MHAPTPVATESAGGHPARKWLRWSFYLLSAGLVAAIAWGLSYIVREGGGSLPVLKQAPGFQAQDLDGRTVTLDTLRGKIFVITWFYTHCPDVCPLTMYRFEQIQDRLRASGELGRQVVLVAVTLDPARDTPAVIRTYAGHFHADPRAWYFLRATPAQTAAMLRRWGIVTESGPKGQIGHTSQVDLVDENGNVRAEYVGADLNPDRVVQDIQGLIERMRWGV
ncbi:cytochrome-c oxidase [Alicyclobacillus cellulosilyticus]|uniref:Cytochrome-c oxidase n=1 Tax=Alicyclobacillus cellulosilyticus TaxID=1003997 RepID=A0A917K351_9BACL|nr:SCO family protein [Alicyclobacillus cellulosilyticus]GGI99041.1 cytochrome-c oxidase [Alicyclobacillus cellulosilyticus]